MRAIAHLAGTRKVSETPALLIKAFDELYKHNTRDPMTVHPELTGFAEACYDTKSMRALLLCLRREKADPIDCLKWNITSQQWRDALVDALEVMIEDYVQERSNER
jgi:hypothetical protein